MTKKKILFFGGSGLLALNWANKIYKSWEVILLKHKRNICFKHARIIEFEKISKSNIIEVINKVNPNLVVNCAAITAVEKCEEEKDNANLVNSVLPEIIANACKLMNIKFVHISTDHLFDGKNSFYHEDNPKSPLNIYGKTKDNAEEKNLLENPQALIVRTNFFGWGTSYRHSFSDWIIKSLRESSAIKLFSDVYFTPIHIEELVKIIHILIDKNKQGIFNVVSKERISKFEFGIKIANIFKYPLSLISPISVEDISLMAQRPKDMSLSTKKILDEIYYQIKVI
ncbi:MAG: SDR family oxidoreductase [Bacteroidota bacterium]|nr:SDR family oxidoreductase [Bacteroidota bacterium]